MGIHKGLLIEYFDAPVETVIFPLAIRLHIPLARFGEWSSKVKGLWFNLSSEVRLLLRDVSPLDKSNDIPTFHHAHMPKNRALIIDKVCKGSTASIYTSSACKSAAQHSQQQTANNSDPT